MSSPVTVIMTVVHHSFPNISLIPVGGQTGLHLTSPVQLPSEILQQTSTFISAAYIIYMTVVYRANTDHVAPSSPPSRARGGLSVCSSLRLPVRRRPGTSCIARRPLILTVGLKYSDGSSTRHLCRSVRCALGSSAPTPTQLQSSPGWSSRRHRHHCRRLLLPLRCRHSTCRRYSSVRHRRRIVRHSSDTALSAVDSRHAAATAALRRDPRGSA